MVTDEEKARIEGLDLANDTEAGPRPWFAPVSRGAHKWRLAHRRQGGCVFLTAGNRCRLEERFGADAKPFVCRLFPFILIPAGDHWRVGMRYSCPSAAANSGRPVTDQRKELAELSRLLERHVGRSADTATPPSLQAGQQLSWSDVCRVVQVLVEIVEDRGERLERRLRRSLAVARVCGQTDLAGLSGKKLTEYLQAVRRGVEKDVPREPGELPAPDPVLGRLLFRVFLAIYAYRDRDTRKAASIRGRLARVGAGWRFATGRGAVPRVNEFLPKTSFDALEGSVGLPPEVDETLERYYVVKLNSLQFCGPPNFDLPLWAGLESLILTLPAILWLARSLTDPSPVKKVEQAIQIVDDHFGGDPMLGFPHIQYLVRTLAGQRELEKLVAWYSR